MRSRYLVWWPSGPPVARGPPPAPVAGPTATHIATRYVTTATAFVLRTLAPQITIYAVPTQFRLWTVLEAGADTVTARRLAVVAHSLGHIRSHSSQRMVALRVRQIRHSHRHAMHKRALWTARGAGADSVDAQPHVAVAHSLGLTLQQHSQRMVALRVQQIHHSHRYAMHKRAL